MKKDKQICQDEKHLLQCKCAHTVFKTASLASLADYYCAWFCLSNEFATYWHEETVSFKVGQEQSCSCRRTNRAHNIQHTVVNGDIHENSNNHNNKIS